MRNDELLDAVKELLEANDSELETQGKDLAYIKGTLDEMKRHNGRIIKALAGIVTALVTAFLVLVGYVVKAA